MGEWGPRAISAFEAAGFTPAEITRLDAMPSRWQVLVAKLLRRDPTVTVDGIHWNDAKRAAFEYVVERRYEQTFGPDWRDHLPRPGDHK